MFALEVLNEFQGFLAQKRIVSSCIISQIGLFWSVFKSKQETRMTSDIFLACYQKQTNQSQRKKELSGNSESEQTET